MRYEPECDWVRGKLVILISLLQIRGERLTQYSFHSPSAPWGGGESWNSPCTHAYTAPFLPPPKLFFFGRASARDRLLKQSDSGSSRSQQPWRASARISVLEWACSVCRRKCDNEGMWLWVTIPQGRGERKRKAGGWAKGHESLVLGNAICLLHCPFCL